MKLSRSIAACCTLLAPLSCALAEGGYPMLQGFQGPYWQPSHSYGGYPIMDKRALVAPAYSNTTYYPPQTHNLVEGFNPYAGMRPGNLRFRPWNDKGTFRPGGDPGYRRPGGHGYGQSINQPAYGHENYSYPVAPQWGYDNLPAPAYQPRARGQFHPSYPSYNAAPGQGSGYGYPSPGYNPMPEEPWYGDWPRPPMHQGTQPGAEWAPPFMDYGMPAPDFQPGTALDSGFPRPGESILPPLPQRPEPPAAEGLGLSQPPLPPVLDDQVAPPAAEQSPSPPQPANESDEQETAGEAQPAPAQPVTEEKAEVEGAVESTAPASAEEQVAPESAEASASDPKET